MKSIPWVRCASGNVFYTIVIMNPSANIAVVPEAGTVGQINSLFFVQTKAAEKADSTRRHSKGGTCPGFQAVGSL